MIDIVLVQVNKAPQLYQISGSLESMQKLVGGRIESLTINDLCIMCNEEGKLIPLPPNRVLRYNNRIVDTIHGDFFVTAYDNEGECVSLSQTEIGKAMSLFEYGNYVIDID